MSDQQADLQECPFCRESVPADATLQLVPEDAEHCYYILDPRSYM